MASMRMCLACDRPNGPHFSRCMTCGAWIGVAGPAQGGPTNPADAADRALRLLEGLTPERRGLLPAEFLRSLQKQARGLGDSAGESGAHRALEIPKTNPEFDARDSLEDLLDMPIDLGDEGMRTERHTEPPLSDFDSEEPIVVEGAEPAPVADEWTVDGLQVELPPVGDAAGDGLGPLWEDPRSMRELAAVAADDADGESSEHMISVLDDFPDLLDDAQWGGSLTGGARESDEPIRSHDPLVVALTEGRGPFGDRTARFRLFLLPSLAYKAQDANLRLVLAEILQIDLYSAGLMLKKPVPTLLEAGEEPRSLNRRARDLRLAGLEVLLIEREYWLDGILPLNVRSVAGRAPGPVTFLLEQGGAETISRERLGYCVFGALQDASNRSIYLLDLYLADAPVCLRIRSDRFDFTVLGAAAEGPPAKLIHRLVHWFAVTPEFPLPLDEAFRLVPSNTRSTSTASPQIEPGVADFTEYSLLCDQGRRVD